MTMPLSIGAQVASVMLTIAFFLAFVRMMKGPTLADRIVALDLMSTLTVGIIALFTIYTGESVFLDAAIVLALISFLGTIAFARYLEKRERKRGGPG